jgi:putative ABC transport system substrate-binding protein
MGLDAAERPPIVARIGILTTGHIDVAVYRAFATQLRDSIPHVTFNLIYREANFSKSQLATQLVELLALHLDVLICMDLFAADFAKTRRSHDSPPIVFLAHADPLASHLIQGYSEPGGNLTGVTTYRCVDGKMIEIMRDAFPGRKRIGYLVDGSIDDDKDCARLSAEVAARDRVDLMKLDVSAPDFLSTLPATLSALHLDAVVAPASAPIWQNRKAVVGAVNDQRLPAIYEGTVFLEEGGLMSYGSVATDAMRQIVSAVDAILTGEAAGRIPVEQPSLFELVINLRAPHFSDFKIRAETLRRADRILE